MDEEKDREMVSSLLEFKVNLDRIWEESFSKNEAFSNTIKDAFEHLINIRQVLHYSLFSLIIFLFLVERSFILNYCVNHSAGTTLHT